MRRFGQSGSLVGLILATILVLSPLSASAQGQSNAEALAGGSDRGAAILAESQPFAKWTAVSAGDGYSLGLRDDGTLWAWGVNRTGQLGDGTNTSKNVPTQIGDDTDWEAISAGHSHSLALKEDGSLWAWGFNPWGQLGDGTGGSGTNANDKNVPVRIGADYDWTAVSAGDNHSCAIKDDGSLWAWGYNEFGRLGNGTTVNTSTPVLIGVATDAWQDVSAGGRHSLAIKDDGTLWAWGYNFYGQLGNSANGATANRNIPTKAGTAADWKAVVAGEDHSLGIKGDGSLWAWGYNNSGQLGGGSTGSVYNKNAPTQIGSGADWEAITARRYHSFGTKRDGSLWAWGNNEYGQLGIGTSGSGAGKDVPTQVETDIGWRAISAGSSHTLATKSDGSLWAWGSNEYGKLGNETTVSTSTPILISGPPPDETPPATICDIEASYVGMATITLTATDETGGSGVAALYYKVDDGGIETVMPTGALPAYVVTATVTVVGDGIHTLEFWAVDNAENEEFPHTEVKFTVTALPDTTPPVSGSDAALGYASAPAVITLTATDETGGSGVAALYYKVDDGDVETVTPTGAAPAYDVTTTITVSEEGTHTLEFWAVDNEENEEEPHNIAVFRVGLLPDKTPPSSACDAEASYVGTATITITATDEGPGNEESSGVREVTYILNDEEPVVTLGDEAVVAASREGTYTLEFWAVDNEENEEEPHNTVTFAITLEDPDDPEPEDMPITATVKDKHAETVHGAGFDSTSTGCEDMCHTDPVITGCTDAGCHRIAEAPDLEPGHTDDDAPESHGYIRPETYGCDGCHRIKGDGSGGTITRISGADRYATAIEVSKRNFTSANAVIIATGANYADALSASALAGSLSAPLLLTRTESLSTGVLGEINRLGAKQAYIMGSSAAVSNAVEGLLGEAGINVERIAGADRYATSTAIADKVAELEGTSFAKKAFLARGDNFADGLAASPLAYRNKMPVVLTRPAELPAPAGSAIQALGIMDVTILGSVAAVSASVEAEVGALGTDLTVRRVAGTDRYATAEAIARHAFDNSLATKNFIGVATGLNFPDALAGGAATGERGGILVLTTPDALSQNWEGYLSGAYGGIKPDIQIYGGDNVVSESVMNKLRAMLID
ncbi:MAG: cell wall-binding repeat-containing protein [Coriobacteriia bacterium]|nr:cell wall-binding repeat-containing protein [Coriobacteriia bacterium]